MPTLTSRYGQWQLPHFHRWEERDAAYRCARVPLIRRDTRIATIGSCFAEEVAKAMERLGLNGTANPTGRVYDTPSIRQEMQRNFGVPTACDDEPLWHTSQGWIHPFKHPQHRFPTEQELRHWSDDCDRRARELFTAADVFVITLGLIECWRQPRTGCVYRHIPHPDVFPQLDVQLHRASVSEMLADLAEIRRLIRGHTHAVIILTVSPVPLHATFTDRDVRVANTESKCRIRAAASEFVEQFPDVHYFHSYELVSAAEHPGEFIKADGRHVQPRAVDYIVNQFLRTFGDSELQVPEQQANGPTASTNRPASLFKLLHWLQPKGRLSVMAVNGSDCPRLSNRPMTGSCRWSQAAAALALSKHVAI